jgi:hypothetical protein
VGIGGDGDACFSEDGDAVEGVEDVTSSEPGLVLDGERLVLGTLEEAGIPTDDGGEAALRMRRAWSGIQ